MKYDVATIGNCVQDIFILADSKFTFDASRNRYISYLYGEKINVNELYYDLGGEACNVAVAMRMLGVKTTIVSMVGDDTYSREVFGKLKKKKVGTSFLYKEYGKDMGLSFILLGEDRDRTILAYRAKNNYRKINLKKLFKVSKSYYIAGINKYSSVLLQPILDNAVRYSKRIYINPSAFQIQKGLPMLKKIFNHSEVAVMNVEEAREILRIKKSVPIKKLLSAISSFGPLVTVITDGRKGAYAYDGEHFFYSDIYKKQKRLDATGAGDSFAATFIAMYKKGYSIENCMKFAMINAASVVSDYGAQRGLLGRREIIRRYRQGNVKIKKI